MTRVGDAEGLLVIVESERALVVVTGVMRRAWEWWC